jgi:serine/threonine-protein kinase
MILQNGLVKVTDFGIAKMMAMGMTQAGQILGTPNYMSPEQVKGRQIDGRSDIFSLGVILYELVTGEKPFGGQNITTVIYKIINENPIPPRELDASIHSGLSYVISKALAKNADERYQTCRELAEDLRNYKNLGSAVTGQGTVMMKAGPASVEAAEPVPPQASALPPQAAPTAVDEAPIASALNIHVIPPHMPRQQSIPQIAWVLGALMLVAVMAGVSYFIFLRPRTQTVTPVVTTSVANVTPAPNPQLPATPSTQPAAPATMTPAGAPTEPTTTSGAATSNREHPARAASGKVGQLNVSANVTGARISVDGRSDRSWRTPYTIPDLSTGAHNIVVSMDGYDDFQQSVMIESGQTRNVVANLSAPSGEVDVITTPAGVEVAIDGRSYGPSPAHATLAAGSHTCTATPPGGAPYQKMFTLRSGQVIALRLKFGTVVNNGIVEVRTIPIGATVMADGAVVGGQTPTSFRLSVGTHTLVISLSGYPPKQRQVAVSDNETTTVNVNLTNQ